MKFLGFWFLSFIIQWIVGFVFSFFGDAYIIAMTALPLALCFSLMSKINRLEEKLHKQEEQEEALKQQEEKQRLIDEEKEQKRIEEEMIALVVASEITEKEKRC